MSLADDIQAKLAQLNPAERRLAEIRLARILKRHKALRSFPTPGHLARFLDPTTVQTPLMTALDKIALACDAGARTHWLISCPPQEGKTQRAAIATPLWFLLRKPSRRIVIASYEQGVAARSGLAIRQAIATHGGGYRGEHRGQDHEDVLGLLLDPDRAQQTNWNLADSPGRRDGGVLSAGIGSALTGRPADVLIIDDPVKDAKAADSEDQRKTAWDWYRSVATTRLAPGAIVIVIQCLTGDTPVLMADGVQRPLRDVRPGDRVATYEDGALTTSTVRNWANQGPDSIFAIRMKSGRVVRANARHPFLTIENGEHVWRRTSTLKPGSVIQAVTGGSGEASPAPRTGATSPQSARAAACLTTTSIAGPAEFAPHPSTPRVGGLLTSSIATASPPPSMTPCWPSRTAAVASAANTPPCGTPEPTGTGSCASTTTTTPAVSGACSATTATWPSGTASLPLCCAPPLSTWRLEPDEVLEVVPCGVEDVFDIQVDRTENFIANGLVSHNTRWHEDDLMGRILREDDAQRIPDWGRLFAPAQAGPGDPLGREVGDWLTSARGRQEADWLKIRKKVGERWWAALYQCAPAPPAGGIFQLKWIENHRVRKHPELETIGVFVDPADNEGTGDEAGLMVAGKAEGEYYILADLSRHMTVGRWLRRALVEAMRWGATSVRYERSLSGLPARARQAWKDLIREAKKLHELWQAEHPGEPWHALPDPGIIAAAAKELAREDSTVKEVMALEVGLQELWPVVPTALLLPAETGVPTEPFSAVGNKAFRARMVAPLYEGGHVHHVGYFPEYEHQLVSWQESQDSPDRMDTGVHALTILSATFGGTTLSGSTGMIPGVIGRSA